jgi:hypothetical protein
MRQWRQRALERREKTLGKSLGILHNSKHDRKEQLDE